MTTLDWVIIAFVVGLAWWGFRRGAVLGASSLIGMFIGAAVGGRIASRLLTDGSSSPYAPFVALGGAVLVGVIVAELAVALGFRFRVMFTSRTARRVDGSFGVVLFAALAFGIVWIGAAAVNQSRVAPQLRSDLRDSYVVQRLNELLPPTSGVLSILASVDPFPQVSGPPANVAAPDVKIAGDPEVATAGASVVRVLGTACGYGVEGSGWVAAPGIVATNTHVIAGESDTTVQPNAGGAQLPARVIWLDARNDLALLAVPGLDRKPLLIVEQPQKGTAAAILGYPLNGPYDVQPARIASTKSVISEDAYGHGPVTRAMTAFRGLVRHGNSGGPLVDDRGYVVGTVFASSQNRRKRGYAVPTNIVIDALRQANAGVPISSGPCA